MIIINSLKSVFTFWTLPMPMCILVPLLFLIAFLFQLLSLNKKAHKALEFAIVFAITILLPLVSSISALILGRNGVGIALIVAIATTAVLPILLGLLLGILVLILKRSKK